MKPSPDRTRGLPRVRVPMTARLTAVGTEPLVCTVRDLGLGGIFLESDTCLRLGDACALEVGIEDAPESPKLVASGRAVRVEPGRGTAIVFTDMSVEAFDQIDRLLAYKAGEGAG